MILFQTNSFVLLVRKQGFRPQIEKVITSYDFMWPCQQYDQRYWLSCDLLAVQVQQEDNMICDAVQVGLESSAYDVGRYKLYIIYQH